MKDVEHLLSFDLFQQIVFWLSVSTRSCRTGRIYLENNQSLLQAETDRELERLVIAHVEDQAEMKQHMSSHLALLRHARRRGGTTSAIREAYINHYGGFTLDIPNWLAEIEHHRLFLAHIRRPERTNRAYCELLQYALPRAVNDIDVAPETVADIQNELGTVLIQSNHYASQQIRLQAFEAAISCHEAALHVFDYQRYPLQYAKTCQCLGLAYQRYSTLGDRNARERAITCFETALRIYTQHHYTEQQALTLTALGNAHALLGNGASEECFHYALALHQSALEAISDAEGTTASKALIQVNLGDTYLRFNIQGHERAYHQAMTCYKTALQLYAEQRFPKEWADIHVRLATIFQYYAEERTIRQDLYLRCAIVCCEEALSIYSIDASPVEYAATLVNLGHLHRQRPDGNHLAALETACQCYRNALRIFTRQAFPAECRMVLNCLSDAETQRQSCLEQRKLCSSMPSRT